MGSRVEEIPEIVGSGSDARGLSQRRLKDYVSVFGYSKSPVATQHAQQAQSLGETSSVLPPPSPGLKRKRSQATNTSQDTIRNSQSCDGNALEKSTSPRRKRKNPTEASAKISAPPPHPITSNLCDTLQPDLALVLIGLNPGLMTAKLGHPYSHPSNGFWKILHSSGITPIQHRPQDHPLLPDLYGIGNTNICARPSRLGSELTKPELLEGAKILDDKLALYRPEAACITGKAVWEALWCFKTGKKRMQGVFRYGWQDEELWLGRTVDSETGEVEWQGSRTFVAPSTSGLNAGMSAAEKEEAWRPIGEWIRAHRRSRQSKQENNKGLS